MVHSYNKTNDACLYTPEISFSALYHKYLEIHNITTVTCYVIRQRLKCKLQPSRFGFTCEASVSRISSISHEHENKFLQFQPISHGGL